MPDILRILYNACDPFKPATPDQWVDCNKERGSKVLTNRVVSELRKTDHFVRFLLSGHFGCGKSSELRHLETVLREKDPSGGGRRYFPVLLDADEYLDRNDADITELLLAIVAEVGETFKTKLSIELKEAYFKDKFIELQEFFGSEADVNDIDVNLWAVKLKIKQLAKDRNARALVRQKLAKQETSLVDAINLLFDRARLELKKKGYDDLVLILDNLEKVRRTEKNPDEEHALHEFFISNAPQLTNFNAHVLYTVPLRLVSSKAGELKEAYAVAPFVLPMIKVTERDRHDPYPPGYAIMRELLLHHLNGYRKVQKDYSPNEAAITLDEAIQPEALDLLIKYSGGSARELMRYIREATSEVDNAPLTREAARAALQSTVDLYSRSIGEKQWEKLATLEISPDQQIDNDDPAYRELLTQVAIMEYRNGGSGDSFSVKDEPWYGVHPIVRELSRFTTAVNKLREQQAAGIPQVETIDS